MDAESREEVFESLRARGIRAIKVVAADGSKANGEERREYGIVELWKYGNVKIWKWVLAAALTLFVLFVFFVASSDKEPQGGEPVRGVGGPGEPTKPEIAFTSEEYRAAFTNLEAQAADIVARHLSAVGSLDLDALVDYRRIEEAGDASDLDSKVRQGYRAVDDSRMEVRDLFKSIFSIFPADCRVEREEAQRLYAETMDRLEASERRIVKDEKALRLLMGNRGKWHCVGDRVVWSDATLSNEFEYFRRDAPPSR